MENIAWMAWTAPTAIFFVLLAMTLFVMTWLAAAYPEAERVGILRIPTTRNYTLFLSLAGNQELLARLQKYASRSAGTVES